MAISMYIHYICTHHFYFLQPMTIMFEVQDLAVASPATVSRCGMVYLEPSILGLAPFVSCWLQSIPDAIKPHKERLQTLFNNYLEVHIYMINKLRDTFQYTKKHNTIQRHLRKTFFREKSAASGGTRTHDTLLSRRVLYQLSY